MEDDELEPLERPDRVEKPDRWRMFTATQLVIVFAITCALWLGLDFSRRVASAQRLRDEVVQLEQDLSREEARNVALKEKLAYTRSDDYVEHWARSDMKMVRPGERLVVPVIATPAAPPPATPAAPPAAPSPWEMWWSLLMGGPGG